MRLEQRPSRARLVGLALCASLLGACGGGGGGASPGAVDAPSGATSTPAAPAAGVYLAPGSTTTALRPSWVAAVGAVGSPATWIAWEALADGDTRLIQGRADVSVSTSPVTYFDATSAQAGQADLRNSRADRLRASLSGLSPVTSLDGSAGGDASLLSLSELSGRLWQGHWRHHGPTPQTRGVVLDRSLSFASAGSRLVFANQTLLNCYVDAELSEHQPGKPGLFTLALTLAQIPGQASCSHAGSYQGLAVALRAAGGGSAQLRLAVIDAATQRAISYVAQSP